MKREKIIELVKTEAKKLTDKETEVFTTGDMYPKCQLCEVASHEGDYKRPGKNLTPFMTPIQLLFYTRGMVAYKNLNL